MGTPQAFPANLERMFASRYRGSLRSRTSEMGLSPGAGLYLLRSAKAMRKPMIQTLATYEAIIQRSCRVAIDAAISPASAMSARGIAVVGYGLRFMHRFPDPRMSSRQRHHTLRPLG